jgi:endonuclease/exonuclease/phosphatase family metal-dependent hydrolase
MSNPYMSRARSFAAALIALLALAIFALPATAARFDGHGDDKPVATGHRGDWKAAKHGKSRHGDHAKWRHGKHGQHGHRWRHHRGGSHRGKPIKVMTRNIYLGGDIGRPLRATQGLPPEERGPAFVEANTTLRAIVDQTNFPLRSEQLAREIATHRPHFVGLQEVALWRRGPLDGSPATTVDYDFLQILLDDLAALGQRYEVVNAQEESDVSGPAVVDGSLQNIRLTMRDVLIKRAHDGVRVLDSGGAQYAARISLTVAGQPVSFIRGYNYADVRAGNKRFRVINTHLESELSDIAYAQAAELLAGPAAPSNQSTIVLCDCNTDPLDASVKPGETHAHRDPYLLITGQGGFADEWLQWAPAEQGFTSGLSELVNDTPEEAAARFDHRIDFVFGRRADGSPIPVDRAEVVGRDPGERTPETPIGRLWPSDHAGVVVRLRP